MSLPTVVVTMAGAARRGLFLSLLLLGLLAVLVGGTGWAAQPVIMNADDANSPDKVRLAELDALFAAYARLHSQLQLASAAEQPAYMQQLKKVEKQLHTLASRHPRWDMPHYYRGLVLMDQQKLPQAKQAFEMAVDLNVNNDEARNSLATTLWLMGQPEQAIPYYRQLAVRHAGNPTFPYNLGVAHQQLGQTELAIQAYQEALKRDPTHQKSLFNLATLAHHQARLDDAEALYQKAMEVKPDSPIGLESLARLDALRQQREAPQER